MLSAVHAIAREEWRLWLRSRVVIIALSVVAFIIVLTSVLNAFRIADDHHIRQHQQQTAETTFLSQPDRHPHRMVHYGHYVFRAPPPLAIFDPGVDKVTGQSIFLEGHRQNTAMFADARASAQIASLQDITPAFVYQVFLPLLLIVLGHGAFVREREARTLPTILAQGISGLTLYAGKMLALAGLSVVFALPIAVQAVVGYLNGEPAITAFGIVLIYLAYLFLWSALVVLCSLAAPSRGLALGSLTVIWLLWSLVIPRLAVASAGEFVPSPGKLETDFRMYADMRKLGDGHNASDPAFSKLRANLLAQYGVETVDELPINFRGLVAQTSEADLADVMNAYAERRMSEESAQAEHISGYSLLSPLLSVATASRRIAGTDLETHHRFLREAEGVRFGFVQGLNKSHAEALSYADDMNRNKNREAAMRARISADNWDILDRFDFQPNSSGLRLRSAAKPLAFLGVWMLLLVGAGMVISARVKT